MSKKQQYELERIGEFISGSLSRKDCALLLNLSERSISRLSTAIKQEGLSAVLHGNAGKTPINKSDMELKDLARKVAIEKYFDFNILHMFEKLQPEINLNISYSTFRKWCHEWKLVKRTRKQQ